jgi:hypothetical protein
MCFINGNNINFTIKTIIFLIVFCRYETWCFALREEHRLRVFKNRVLRRIFERKREKANGGLRNVDNEVLNNQHSSLNIIRVNKCKMMRCAGHVELLKEVINSYRILIRRPESNRPPERPRRSWEGRTGYETMGRIYLVQNKDQLQAIVNTAMNCQIS